MNRLRNRLIAFFTIATLVPLGVTMWVTKSLLDRSLNLAATRELDETSRLLEDTGRALYQSTREAIKVEVAAGRIQPRLFLGSTKASWPETVRDFADSRELERYTVSGPLRDRIDYMVRRGDTVLLFTRPIAGPGMRLIELQHSRIRALVEKAASRDLRRGFTYTLILVAAAVWMVSLLALVLWAQRLSRPIEQLTAGLSQLAAGNLEARLKPQSTDEVAQAMHAFNYTAAQLQQSRERLVYVTRIASWQSLARKMAHEVKNSLTPIRLTMEEVLVRRGELDDNFIAQAAQIVVDEVGTLERRVRAFSEFSAEPPVLMMPLNVNQVLEERIGFLRNAHPDVTYNVRLDSSHTNAIADEDLIKGILTNLLENAAQAAGAGGTVLSKTFVENGSVGVEIHDSGPGLSVHAKGTLFEPTITFKRAGMGLGLSIAKRSALMLGGDVMLVDGELGGAAFRVMLPRAGSHAG